MFHRAVAMIKGFNLYKCSELRLEHRKSILCVCCYQGYTSLSHFGKTRSISKGSLLLVATVLHVTLEDYSLYYVSPGVVKI